MDIFDSLKKLDAGCRAISYFRTSKPSLHVLGRRNESSNPEMLFRSWKMICIWAVLAFASLCVASFGTSESIVGSLLLASYSLQGFAAELMGISVDETSISFPNRLIRLLPVLTLWRTSLLRQSFDRIDRSGERGVVIWSSGEPIKVTLPSAETRKAFLSICAKMFPQAKIAR